MKFSERSKLVDSINQQTPLLHKNKSMPRQVLIIFLNIKEKEKFLKQPGESNTLIIEDE